MTTLSLLMTSGQLWANMRLINNHAPAGILSFEFAGTLANARLMIHSWDYIAKLQAAFCLGVDFLNLVMYSTAFSIACLYIARMSLKNSLLSQVGIAIAWLQWIAALFDGVENISLMALLSDSNYEWLPPLAYAMAAAKFAFVGLALLYLFTGFFNLWWQIRTDT
ncbi:MAG: hypothetical protein RMJ87_02435 [Cytophagales bacterium]|nr:hypothetical protein [Cytophagales bacterium]